MDAFSLNSLKSAVFMQECVISNPAGYELDTISPGIATGTLTGGNLSVIISTLGSPFQPDMKGKILFIEEVDEPTYKIDRMLTALSLAGVFDKCSGVILGYFSGCETYTSTENLTLNEIFSNIFKKHEIPVLSGLCAGHSYPQLTLPFGASIKMNATLKTIELI